MPCSPVNHDHLELVDGGWNTGVDLALTAARRLSKRAVVVGTWNCSLVITSSTHPS
jgi:hypothetical protein